MLEEERCLLGFACLYVERSELATCTDIQLQVRLSDRLAGVHILIDALIPAPADAAQELTGVQATHLLEHST